MEGTYKKNYPGKLYSGQDGKEKLKEMVQKVKKQAWEEFVHQIETNFEENQKMFYRAIKSKKEGTQERDVR